MEDGMGQRRAIVFTCSVLILIALPTMAGQDGKPAEERALYRFEFDNDTFFESDDAFTAGWSFQRHSRPWDTWDETKRNGFSRWIARHIPGLSDDGEGGRRVRLGWGISQVMQTPEDIENPDSQPWDIAWVGLLGAHWSWQSVSQRRLGAFQIYIGCSGECSMAEQVQKFVHNDLGAGDDPVGWDNQLDTEPHLNLNYSWRRKLADTAGVGKPGRWAADLAVGGQAGVGTLFNLAEVQAEFRFGRSLPEGFTHLPDVPGRGISMEPTPQSGGRGWATYFSIVPRYVYAAEVWTFEGGDTVNGPPHPGIEYDNTFVQWMFGLHIRCARFSFHLTYFYFPDAIGKAKAVPPAGITAPETKLEWANLSWEYRW
jgi:hypothetical protein